MTITAPDGAYIIGGGKYHFGQAVTEDLARAAFEFPMPTLGNMIELLRSVLELLPLDALKPFKGFLGLDDAHFGTVVDAVNNIISSLQQRPIFMLLTDFTSWVKDLVQAITGVANGDLSMLTTWFQSNVLDQINDIWVQLQSVLGSIVDFVTNSDLVLAIQDFVTNNQLLSAIQDFITSIDLADAVGNIVKALTGTAGALSDLSAWVAGVLNPVLSGFQLLLDALFSLFGGGSGTGKPVADAIAALTTWVNTTFKGVSDGLTAIVKTVTDLINGLFGLFGGTGTVSLAGMLTAAGTWMTHWQEFVDGIWTAFSGGVAGVGKTVADAVTALKGWFGNFHKLLDALFGAFGGVAGTDKTITDVIGAITGWFTNVFQKLIDGINALASLIPGFSTGSNPIQNAVNIISGILGIGQSAAASAAQANLGVAAIVAAQNGGSHDDFDYAVSASLPSPWVSTYSGDATGKLGPDGRGYVVWSYSGLPNTYRAVHYRKSDVTMPNSDCIITAVLSKAPGYGTTDHCRLWIEALWSATDQSRLMVQIGPNYAQLQSVSATGAITNVGAKHTIPNVHNGDSFALKIRGNDVSLMAGTITHFTETVAVGSFTGRQFGFGAMYAGVILGFLNGPELTGITWQN